MQCTRGVGRPKKKRFGAPSLLKSRRKVNEEIETKDNKKGRGRPKGSKNKRTEEPIEEPPPKRQKKTMRERAEEAADFGSIVEDPEACMICQFRFDDPIKREKMVARCRECNTLVHEPCLMKSGCISDDCFLKF